MLWVEDGQSSSRKVVEQIRASKLRDCAQNPNLPNKFTILAVECLGPKRVGADFNGGLTTVA
jgi:hypothetical protein